MENKKFEPTPVAELPKLAQWFHKVFSFMDRLTSRQRNWFIGITLFNVICFLLLITAAKAGLVNPLILLLVLQGFNFWYYVTIKNDRPKSKSRDWVDTITFAVVAATFIRTFFIEAYTIPTPSMENSLLVGDFLFVSKMSYGAPFIYRYGPIGYFTVDKKLGIYFAFYWGKLLVPFDESGIFHHDDRKMVKLVMLKNRMSDEDFLGSFLQLLEKALVIDGENYGKRII